MSSDDPRFGGVARLYGAVGLARLQAAHVAVVGVGGVGSWAAEALARTGIGEISLFDMDDVCVSNTNRQSHALEGNVGQPKVEVLAQRLRAINPACKVNAVVDYVTKENLAEYLTDRLDYVVDCIDSVNAKAAVIAWCKRRKLPIVTTGGAGGQVDPTQIGIVDLNRTWNDPLASKVRSLLRKDYGFSRNTSRNYGVPCVYSTEQLRYPGADGSVCTTKAFVGEGVKLDCAGGFGAVMMVTATFGMVAASRVVDKLVAKAETGIKQPTP